MKINVSAIAGIIIRKLVGTATGNTIIAFLEGGLHDAVSALVHGDILGFLAALPVELRSKIEQYYSDLHSVSSK